MLDYTLRGKRKADAIGSRLFVISRAGDIQNIQNGFWINLHPKELCGRLGSYHVNVAHVFEGNHNFEKLYAIRTRTQWKTKS